MAASHGTKAILAAFFANLCIAIAKFVAWVFTGSSSMLAESLHSLADTGNQALLIVGKKQALREASARHAFGYGRARYFWSFVVALVLFSLGGLFSIYEGYHKLNHPQQIKAPTWAFAVLIVAILLETGSFWTAIQESRAVKGTQTWLHFIRHSRSPELPVVLLEDAGALLGLIFALIGITIAVVTENPMYDALGTIVIGVLLVAIAVILVIEMKSLLLGESATTEEVKRMEELITATPSVKRLIHMRTQHLGPDEVLIAAKVAFEPLDFASLARAIDDIETRIRAEISSAKWIFIEPDVLREPKPQAAS